MKYTKDGTRKIEVIEATCFEGGEAAEREGSFFNHMARKLDVEPKRGLFW